LPRLRNARTTWVILALSMAVLLGLGVGGRAWQAREERVAVAKALTGGGEPNRAAWLLTRYGCGGCHTISGVPGADGQVAPPLNGLVQRVYIGGIARNTPENLVAWIVNPQQFSPHSAMPPTGIGPEDARDVAAYLYAQQ